MLFKNSNLGKCVLLKEDKKNDNYLIFSISGKQFIVASGLDKKTGSWLHGYYFFNDLDEALSLFNERVKKEELER